MTAVVLLLSLLAGCSPNPSDSRSSPSTPGATGTGSASEREHAERAQQLLTEFLATARRGDSTTALVSTRDPVFAARAAVWSANLGRIDWSVMTWSANDRSGDLPPDRRASLGPTAWVQSVVVRWALPGQSEVAEDEVWLTFLDESSETDSRPATRLVGDGDGPRGDAPTPLWWLQPVSLQRDGSTLLLSARPEPTWLGQAAAARQAVRQRIGPADRDPDGPLVVELPQSRAVFERTLGVPATSYAGVAAAAWPMGPDAATAPIHVVVNPEATERLSDLGREVLLTHEAVHVATRSPGSRAPTWLVEGYADQIAYRAHPTASAPAKAAVRERVRAKGAPRDWPSESDFAPDADAHDLDLAYDLAWTAARSISSSYGDDALNRFYVAVDGGASVDRAARTIGTTAERLRRQWRSDLVDLAGR